MGTMPDTAPAWEQRLRAAYIVNPEWADDAPDRMVFTCNASGTYEVYAWERGGRPRQVTDRPNGTFTAAISPDGEWIWWFADTDGDEFGVWMRQPFAGGPDEAAVPGLDKAYSTGLALGRTGVAVIGRSTDEGSWVHVARHGGEPVTIYHHREDSYVIGLTHDDDLVAIGHSEHGDARHKALRVLTLAGETVADLWDGPGKGLAGVRFAPLPGDRRLLALHERHGRWEPLVWDVATGEQTEIALDLPGEISADWYPDGRALLVRHAHQARSELYRYDLATGELESLGLPKGTVRYATARPDGSVEYLWSSAEHPPALRSTRDEVVLTPPGITAPPSVPVEDAWVDGPGGRVHALVARPAGAAGPYPTVFLVHGGPEAHDTDSFAPGAAAWVDHGFAVVRVNYRGSTGYGKHWRDALAESGRIGLTELEDIAAVRDWAVRSGLTDPGRIVLAGASWGGYLTLLGLGTQPDLWSLGIAGVPVADYVAAYEDEMEELRAFDRTLFGGTPQEVPERYERSSPITYVANVRVPVFISAGVNDPRCPIRQIENYLNRLAELGTPYEVYRYEAGHSSFVVEERIKLLRAEIEFARKHLGV
ncbi:prolyl oligopeptidase family serine peptidase [Carbonactinospora thermoautotrophica]